MILYTRIIDELNNARNELEQTVTQGQAHDYESYRYFIGRIQGLKDALDICKDTLKRSNNE